MARFNYSGVAITGGTGRLNSSLGGSVLMKNGVVRNYVTPTNPQTLAQTQVRALFLFLTNYWTQGLLEAQRQLWETARTSGAYLTITDPFTGTTRAPRSAKDLYISINMHIGTATGYPLGGTIAVPAAAEVPGDTTFDSLIIDASSGTVAVGYNGTLGTNEVHVARFTDPLNGGVLILPPSKLRVISYSAAVSPLALGASYVAKFGAITAKTGKAVFMQLGAINALTGQTRNLISTRTIIVA